MPEWIQVNAIEASPHDRGGAYVAATMYKLDDFRPYLFKTADFGKTWTKIVSGIPDDFFTRVVRADPVRRGLLYAGTEYGLFVSFDDGARWEPFQRNLPVVPITDLAVKDADLVVATQGRAFWVLDDVTPLREWRDDVRGKTAELFTPRPTARYGGGDGPGGDEEAAPTDRGKNPPGGVLVYYWLKDAPPEKEPVVVEILDGDKVLRSYTSEKKEKAEGEAEPDERADKPIEPKKGLNRLVWDMRILRPALLPKAVIWGNDRGPAVAPGSYTVRLKAAGQTLAKTAVVVPRPGISATPEDLRAQFDLLRKTRDGLAETHDAVRRIREVKAQIETVVAHAEALGKGADLKAKGKTLSEKLTAVEKKLVNPDVKANQDVLNFPPALDHQFAGLASVVSSADAKPTDGSVVYFGKIRGELDGIEKELRDVLDSDLAAFNRAVQQAGIPPVVEAPKKQPAAGG
jgi:hypothetical protein